MEEPESDLALKELSNIFFGDESDSFSSKDDDEDMHVHVHACP